MSDLIGKVICGYRVVSEIGEGGMGKVYLAESAFLTEYKQQVAIKTLTSVGASERQAAVMRDLFVREANIQVQLSHPHIVSVIQFAVEGDQYFLILEYLPGYRHQGRRLSNVADVIQHETGPIPTPLALRWFAQALEAMNYAHNFRYRWQGEERIGIVHRDIKPANLLLANPETIKVSDFGIVKVQQHGRTVTRNLTPGTSAYMSPEAILGPQQFNLPELDARSDIYSLGVTLYEMLTARLPFTPEAGAPRDISLRRQHVHEPPPPPSSFNSALTPAIDALVLRALEKNPDHRYQSADEFKRAVIAIDRRAAPPSDEAPLPFATRPFQATELIVDRETAGDAGVVRTSRQNDPYLTSPVGAASTPVSPPIISPHPSPVPRPSRRGPYLALGLLLIAALSVVGWYYAQQNATVAHTDPPPATPTPAPAPPPVPAGMVAIPGGTFLMGRDLSLEERDAEVRIGSRRSKVFEYDWPAHEKKVEPFFLARTEVSNREYGEFVRATNHAPPKHWKGSEPPLNAENMPVTHVTYQDAVDHCSWLTASRRDGFIYRLPTEEEWEFAARGPVSRDTPRRLYPWGEAWEAGKANTLEAKLSYPQIITANPDGASPYGLLNLAGNVYEWTASDFKHYPGSDRQTPRAKGYQGVYQVVRGGSFDYPKESAMATTRAWARPTDYGPRLGFRCAAQKP